MHEFVFGKLGPRHAGAISDLLSIMALEVRHHSLYSRCSLNQFTFQEELLVLRHQIQDAMDGRFPIREASEEIKIDIESEELAKTDSQLLPSSEHDKLPNEGKLQVDEPPYLIQLQHEQSHLLDRIAAAFAEV